MRTSAKRSDVPLVDFESTDDVEALLDAPEAAGTRAASTLNNHLSALRGFWQWLEGTDSHAHDDYRFRHFIENVEPSEDDPGRDAADPSFVLCA
jgi:site-specific recombinase XerD